MRRFASCPAGMNVGFGSPWPCFEVNLRQPNRPALGVRGDRVVHALVLAHGWGGSKLTAERYAALFASSGMIALTFTQPTWFDSDSRLQ